LTIFLLAIWFAVSFGAGILFREALDNFSIGGAPLGFWFAQNGSIYVFLALIVILYRVIQIYGRHRRWLVVRSFPRRHWICFHVAINGDRRCCFSYNARSAARDSRPRARYPYPGAAQISRHGRRWYETSGIKVFPELEGFCYLLDAKLH